MKRAKVQHPTADGDAGTALSPIAGDVPPALNGDGAKGQAKWIGATEAFLERGDKCDASAEEIGSSDVHIKNAAHPSIDLSVEAFVEGQSLTNPVGATHHPGDSYHVMDTLDFPLLCDDWTAEDELGLLAGLESTRGAEDWDKIAEFVGKPALSCRRHYKACYVSSGATSPIPDIDNIAPKTIEEARKWRERIKEGGALRPSGKDGSGARHKASRKVGKSVSRARPQAGEARGEANEKLTLKTRPEPRFAPSLTLPGACLVGTADARRVFGGSGEGRGHRRRGGMLRLSTPQAATRGPSSTATAVFFFSSRAWFGGRECATQMFCPFCPF